MMMSMVRIALRKEKVLYAEQSLYFLTHSNSIVIGGKLFIAPNLTVDSDDERYCSPKLAVPRAKVQRSKNARVIVSLHEQ